MKRLVLIFLVLGLWAPAAQAASPAVTTRLLECASSLDPAARTMIVEGRMRTLDGARRLQMRFDLQTRLPGKAKWTRVTAPGFGAWNTADPAPRRYVFDKRVEGLLAPARYRMVVRFRWLAADGRRLAGAERTSASCTQADLRPDLEPQSLRIAATERPGTSLYVVPVRNTGLSAAEPFRVGLTVDGVILRPVAVVTGLPAGQRSELAFEGASCRPGRSVVVRVDADGAVDESDEADNELVRACPAG